MALRDEPESGRWVPEFGVYADRAGQPPKAPVRLPEMSDAERAWFDTGVERGFLTFYSICSSHQQHDESCGRCGIGSWGLRSFNGLWAFQRATSSSET